MHILSKIFTDMAGAGGGGVINLVFTSLFNRKAAVMEIWNWSCAHIVALTP